MQKRLILFISWFLLTGALALSWYLQTKDLIQIGLAVLGSLVGAMLPVFLDVLLPRVMHADTKIDRALAQNVLAEGMSQVKQGNLHTEDAPRTPLRSYPLLAAYFLSAIIVITSSQSFFGRGFIFGLGLSLVLDLWFCRRPIENLKTRWFSVFHANLSDQEFDYFVYGSVGVYIFLVSIGLFV